MIALMTFPLLVCICTTAVDVPASRPSNLHGLNSHLPLGNMRIFRSISAEKVE